jgi:hypothetical protein
MLFKKNFLEDAIVREAPSDKVNPLSFTHNNKSYICPEKIFDRFEITAKLAQGGSSVVFEALDIKD